jgi:hypothetical protein
LTQSWENPKLEEDKMFLEDPSPTISFKSKETILGLGGIILRESGMLPCLKGIKLEILRKWSKYASPPKRRVVLIEDCIGNVT